MADKLRDAVLAKLDVEGFYRDIEGIELVDVGKGQLTALCPFHEDHNPTLQVRGRDGVFNCFSCGAKGSVYDLHIRKNKLGGSAGEQFKVALRAVAEYAGVPLPGSEPQPLLDTEVLHWMKNLKSTKQRYQWLQDKRGFTEETIEKYQLGWDGGRITIPVRDLDGQLVNVRRYLPNSTTLKGKMLGIVGHNERRLFNPVAENQEEIILAEGEMDCILALQEGFNADTVTSGAGNWKDEFTPRFRNKRVVICYDNDDTGRRGTQVVGRYLSTVTDRVHAIKWPEDFKAKGDITDFIIELGSNAEDLAKLIADAPLFVPIKDEKDWGYRYPLTDMGNAERFTAKYSEKLKYVSSWGKWLVWNGEFVWKVDETMDVTKLAMKAVREIKIEAAELDDEKAQIALKKFALLSEGERKIAAMVTLARSKLATNLDMMNNNPWLLNCPNGVLNLKRSH